MGTTTADRLAFVPLKLDRAASVPPPDTQESTSTAVANGVFCWAWVHPAQQKSSCLVRVCQ